MFFTFIVLIKNINENAMSTKKYLLFPLVCLFLNGSSFGTEQDRSDLEKARIHQEKVMEAFSKINTSRNIKSLIVNEMVTSQMRLETNPPFQGKDFGFSFPPLSFADTVLEGLEYLSKLKDPIVCDVGAGSGKLIRPFSLLSKKIDAIEINPELAEKNRESFKSWVLNQSMSMKISKERADEMINTYTVIAESFLTAQISSNTYDLIVCSNLIHFFSPVELDEIVFPKLLRISKPRGKIIIIAQPPVGECPEIINYYFRDQEKYKEQDIGFKQYPGYHRFNLTYFAKFGGKIIVTDPIQPLTLNETVGMEIPGHHQDQNTLEKIRKINVESDGFSVDWLPNEKEVIIKGPMSSKLMDRTTSLVKSNRVNHYFTQKPLREALERCGFKTEKTYFIEGNGIKITKALKVADFCDPQNKGIKVVAIATKPVPKKEGHGEK